MSGKTNLVLIAIFSAIVANAQPLEVELWSKGAPNSNGITTPEKALDRGRVANVSHPMLYVYLPQSATPAAAVVICPGGGYARLSMQSEGHDFAQWLAANNIAGIVLKYRMPNGHHDVPLSDARQALRIVRERSKEWNIAPDKVGVAGFSAGGHLAATVATHFVDSTARPDFTVLFYPVITMDSFTHQGSHNLLIGKTPSQELQTLYSNELQVTSQTPPAILLLSDDDKTVPPRNSTAFYDALKQHKTPAAMYIFPTGGHGWGMKPDFAYHSLMKELLRDWLQKTILK